jgi:hypothetical protein
MNRAEISRLERRVASLEKQALLGIDLKSVAIKLSGWLDKSFPNRKIFLEIFRKYLPNMRSRAAIEKVVEKSKKLMMTPKGKKVRQVLQRESTDPVKQAKILANSIRELESRSLQYKTASSSVTDELVEAASEGEEEASLGDFLIFLLVILLVGFVVYAVATQGLGVLFLHSAHATKNIRVFLTVVVPIAALAIGWFISGVKWFFNQVLEEDETQVDSENTTDKYASYTPELRLRRLHARIASLEFNTYPL